MTPQLTHGRGTHVPVLLEEAMAFLAPRTGGIYVDGTFGAGGYSIALLEKSECQVVGIDRDPAAIAGGTTIGRRFSGRLTLLEGCFGDMPDILAARGLTAVDGVALDLGISALQLGMPERGFSFQTDGPLDMRMGRDGLTAADVINSCSEAELAHILHTLGEERLARRIACALVAARPITRTASLAALVRRIVPRAHDGLDPATRTFQALRLFVNDEPSELDRVLIGSEQVLMPGGRLVVVAFHSLEDRTIKRFLRVRACDLPHASRHRPEVLYGRAPTFRILTRRAVRPRVTEIAINPRARSARLRAAERTAAPSWPEEMNKRDLA